MAQKMTDDEWRAFVSHGTRTGQLSTVRADGSPNVTPIRFLLDGNGVVFDAGKSTVKGRILACDGWVTLRMDDGRPPYDFAVRQGRAQLWLGSCAPGSTHSGTRNHSLRCAASHVLDARDTCSGAPHSRSGPPRRTPGCGIMRA
jgi:hypothetical protein